jgi:hypothetical protein
MELESAVFTSVHYPSRCLYMRKHQEFSPPSLISRPRHPSNVGSSFSMPAIINQGLQHCSSPARSKRHLKLHLLRFGWGGNKHAFYWVTPPTSLHLPFILIAPNRRRLPCQAPLVLGDGLGGCPINKRPLGAERSSRKMRLQQSHGYNKCNDNNTATAAGTIANVTLRVRSS